LTPQTDNSDQDTNDTDDTCPVDAEDENTAEDSVANLGRGFQGPRNAPNNDANGIRNRNSHNGIAITNGFTSGITNGKLDLPTIVPNQIVIPAPLDLSDNHDQMATPRPSARTYTPFFATAHRPPTSNMPASAAGNVNETGSSNIAGGSSYTANQDISPPTLGALDAIIMTTARRNAVHLAGESRENGDERMGGRRNR
jgi:hypothetical protein